MTNFVYHSSANKLTPNPYCLHGLQCHPLAVMRCEFSEWYKKLLNKFSCRMEILIPSNPRGVGSLFISCLLTLTAGTRGPVWSLQSHKAVNTVKIETCFPITWNHNLPNAFHITPKNDHPLRSKWWRQILLIWIGNRPIFAKDIINVSAPKQDSQMVSLPRVQEMALMQADSQSASYTRGWQGRADKNQHFSSTEQKDILHSSTCSASPVSWLHTQRTRDVTELSHYSENQHTAVCSSLEWDDPNSPARPAFDYCLDKTQASVPSSPKTIYLMQML